MVKKDRPANTLQDMTVISHDTAGPKSGDIRTQRHSPDVSRANDYHVRAEKKMAYAICRHTSHHTSDPLISQSHMALSIFQGCLMMTHPHGQRVKNNTKKTVFTGSRPRIPFQTGASPANRAGQARKTGCSNPAKTDRDLCLQPENLPDRFPTRSPRPSPGSRGTDLCEGRKRPNCLVLQVILFTFVLL